MLSKLSSPLILLFFFFLAGVSLITTPAFATDHIVGANKGWNPGINYTFWANNHTFYVDDLISFRYKKMEHNVFEVDKTGYDKCITKGALGNWSSGKDFIPLKKPGRYYFVCGVGGCLDGMKVSILVHALPPPPSSPITETKHSSSTESSKSAAMKVIQGRPLLVSSALVVTFVASISTGFGWV